MMAAEKQDLRVKKTQRSLATAMLTLLEKNHFGKITVNDLCTEAMVSRTAFYSHYGDKYALLSFCMLMLKEQLFEETRGENMQAHLRKVLEKISEHTKMFRNLLLSNLDAELMEMLRLAFHEDFEQMLLDLNLDADALPGPAELISAYFASGVTSVIVLWLSKNMNYSIDEVTDCIIALLPKEVILATKEMQNM